MTETKTKSIIQRMAKATDDIKGVAKNLTVSTGKGQGYKAVSEVDVLKAVRDAEKANGIYSYPVNRELVDSDLIEKQSQYGTRSEYFMRLRTTYRFVNVDDPTDYIEIISYSDGIDSGDKATGKAMTYGDKYALLKAYKIPTGEDPDQDASDDTAGTRKARQTSVQARQATKQAETRNYTQRDLIDRITQMYTLEQVQGMLERLGKDSLMALDLETLKKMAKVQ